MIAQFGFEMMLNYMIEFSCLVVNCAFNKNRKDLLALNNGLKSLISLKDVFVFLSFFNITLLIIFSGCKALGNGFIAH